MSGGIIRVNKRGSKGYFMASNAPFNDEALTWEARGLMGYLLSKPDGWETRNSDLISKGPAGEHKLSRMLKELKDGGYMHRYRRNAGGGLFDWITEIYERPELNPHWSPYGENGRMDEDDAQPYGDEPSMDQPSMDNRPINQILSQSNTKTINTEITTTSTSPAAKKAVDDVDDEDVFEETGITPSNPMPAEVAAMATAVADWMGYTGDITREMQQHQVTPAVLLAWAFWLKVEGGKCRNPVGVCRSKWSSNERRGPELPPARWLELAQAWLDLDNDERLELLGTGGISHLLAFEFPFPDIMPAFCDLYRATSGQPVPAILLPEYPDDPERDTPAAPAAPDNQAATAVPGVDQLWRDMIQNDSSPAVKTWLQASRLLVDPGSLTAVVCVRNSYAAEYVSGRLLDYLNMAWPSLAAESGWENLRITGAVDHATA